MFTMKLSILLKTLYLLFLVNSLILGTAFLYESNYYYIKLNPYLYLFILLIILSSCILLLIKKQNKNVVNKEYKIFVIILISLLLYFIFNDLVVNHFEFSNIKNYSIFILFCLVIIFYRASLMKLSAFIEHSLIILYFIYVILYFFYYTQNIDSIGFRLSRPAILLGNANEDGGLLSVLFALIMFSKNLRAKPKYIIIVLHFYILVLLNGTRTSLISSFMVFLFFIYADFFEENKKRAWVIIFISLIFFSISVNFISNNNNYSTDIDLAIDESTFVGRYTGIWYPAVVKVLQESPLLGFGNAIDLSRVTFYSSKSSTIYFQRSFHNFFVQFLYKWGIVAFSILLYFIYKIYMFSRKTKRLSIQNQPLRKRILSTNLAWICFLFWSLTANSFSVAGWFTISILFTYTISNYEKSMFSLYSKTESCETI